MIKLYQFLKNQDQIENRKKIREQTWHFWTKKVIQQKFWYPKILVDDLPLKPVEDAHK